MAVFHKTVFFNLQALTGDASFNRIQKLILLCVCVLQAACHSDEIRVRYGVARATLLVLVKQTQQVLPRASHFDKIARQANVTFVPRLR